MYTSDFNKLTKTITSRRRLVRWWFDRSILQKAFVVFVSLGLITYGSMYVVARWYIAKYNQEPLKLGVTFIPSYAEYYGLDPKETLSAMINDLGVKRVRLVSYWDDYEKSPGVYDFSGLDWQFAMAEKANMEVSLSIGLRQPRWPECHMPAWAGRTPKEEWAPKLKDYMGQVIDRYKNSPALVEYQLENEYFLKVFGICPDHSRERLVDEFNYVRSKDSKHKLVVSMSNNAIGTPLGEPTSDEWAISVYKRVYDKTFTRSRYLEYPFPAWYYAFRAGFTEITQGHNSFIHELQAEAWTPGNVLTTSLEEQAKSMDAPRLRHRIQYGRETGMRTIDLWGAEWWYWHKVKLNDPSLWDVVKDEVAKTKADNAKLKPE